MALVLTHATAPGYTTRRDSCRRTSEAPKPRPSRPWRGREGHFVGYRQAKPARAAERGSGACAAFAAAHSGPPGADAGGAADQGILDGQRVCEGVVSDKSWWVVSTERDKLVREMREAFQAMVCQTPQDWEHLRQARENLRNAQSRADIAAINARYGWIENSGAVWRG